MFYKYYQKKYFDLFSIDLLKKKAKLSKDNQRQSDLGDVLFRIGYLYYQKGLFF